MMTSFNNISFYKSNLSYTEINTHKSQFGATIYQFVVVMVVVNCNGLLILVNSTTVSI